MLMTDAHKARIESLFEKYVTNTENGNSEAAERAWVAVERYADSLRNAGYRNVTKFVDNLDECEEDRIALDAEDYDGDVDHDSGEWELDHDWKAEQFADMEAAYA